ncbi:MAG: hypothetical protein ABWJ42_05725 [Sulfolobales archaeon]
MFQSRKSLIDLIKDQIPQDLSKSELEVLEYFLRYLSVGEIIALKEIRLLYKIEEPEQIIDKLIKKGLIERGEGCFNLSRRLREVLKNRK